MPSKQVGVLYREGNIGFLRLKNRVNVMLSRARDGMYILGNRRTLEARSASTDMWPQVRTAAYPRMSIYSHDGEPRFHCKPRVWPGTACATAAEVSPNPTAHAGAADAG